MSNHLLQINLSPSFSPDDENLTQIKLENGETLQFNLWKLFYLSKYIHDKYKYSEALNSIQHEIEQSMTTMQIKEETIKLFIHLIQDDKVEIPIEQYKDFYRLSDYFKVTRITQELEKISQKELFNDIDFAIQILVDLDSSNDEHKSNLQSKIETFLASRTDEFIKSPKLGELQISVIHRILLKKTNESANYDSLVDFILDSIETRFTLLKFVVFHKLTNEKIEHLIDRFDELEDQKRKMYLDFLPFDLLFIKQMNLDLCQTKQNYDQKLNQTKQELNKTKQNYDKIKQELDQTKQNYDRKNQELNQIKQNYDEINLELNQTKQELDQTKQNYDQKNQELSQIKQNYDKIKQDLDQTKIKLEQIQNNRIKSEIKQYAKNIIVAGSNSSHRLCEDDSSTIKSPKKIPIDSSSLLSYSAFDDHSVMVTRNGSLLAIGERPKDQNTKKFTEFSFKSIGSQYVPVSAVCCLESTLYLFSKVDGSGKQLVFNDGDIKEGDSVILNIGNQDPVALFGLFHNAAAINRKVKSSSFIVIPF